MQKIFLSLFVLSTLNLAAQTPGWAWASNNPSVGNVDVSTAVTTDISGNVYYTGEVRGTVPGSVYTSNNIFLTKTDPAGNILWSKLIGGDADDVGTAVATDNIGNIYLTGKFQSASVAFTTATITSAGATDVFFAKFNSSGTELWVKKFGGTQYDESYGIAVDAAGNINITGDFTSQTVSIGTTTLTNTHGANAIKNSFIAKYNPSGNAIWAMSFAAEASKAVATDATGNIFISGRYDGNSPTSFGSVTVTPTFGSMGAVYITKLDSSGTPLWAKLASNTNPSTNFNDYDVSNTVCVDKAGNAYIAGRFTGQKITFGSYVLNNTNTSPNYDYDSFVVKYNAAGNEVWAKSLGNTVTDEIFSMAIDSNANLFLAGYYTSASLTVGSHTIINDSVNKKDILIVKYDSTGNNLWALSAGNKGDDEANGICADNFGNVYVVGDFKSSGFTAYTLPLGSNTLTNTFGYYSDAFIGKLGSNTSAVATYLSEDDNVLVYPNPSNGNFSIKMPKETKSITITNALGELIFTAQINNQTDLQYDLKDNGLYFVRTNTNNQTITKKIIVNNK